MATITKDKYIALEWTLGRVSSAVGQLATKEVKEDLKTCEYILSVVRSYAVTFDTLPVAERDEALRGLFDALYR